MYCRCLGRERQESTKAYRPRHIVETPARIFSLRVLGRPRGPSGSHGFSSEQGLRLMSGMTGGARGAITDTIDTRQQDRTGAYEINAR